MGGKKEIFIMMFMCIIFVYILGYIGLPYIRVMSPDLHNAITTTSVMNMLRILPITYMGIVTWFMFSNEMVKRSKRGRLIPIGPYSVLLLILHFVLATMVVLFTYISNMIFGHL